jgi:hypothetical protein
MSQKKCEKYGCPYHDCLSDDCRYNEVIKDGGDFGMTDQEHYEEELKLMRMNMEISIYEN